MSTTPPQELALVSDATLSPQPVVEMMQAVIKAGITAESAGVMERLVALMERVEGRTAEKAFNAAFVALQADLPVIVASTAIANRGKYERFEDVMRVVGPLLVKHGFTVSFSMVASDSRITEVCHLKHIGGHSQSNAFTVRTGNKADSETQADCKAATTAKRNALLNCLNIIIRQDAFTQEDDATQEGGVIGSEKLQYFKELVRDTESNEVALLKLFGFAKAEEITEASYHAMIRALQNKVRK